MKVAIAKFLSKFTKAKLPIGSGVSTDDSLFLSKPPSQEQIEMAQREGRAIYEYRNSDEVGRFELMDVVRKRDVPMYRLKHTLTGEVLDLTKTAFELIFQRQGTK